MTMAMAAPAVGTMGGRRGGGPSGLADVLDVLLDKGLVIDAFVRVSLIGIELLTIDARVVVASVDTYLRFAEAVNRLDLTAVGDHATIQDIGREGAEQKTKGAIEGIKEEFNIGRGDREKEKAGAKS
jgi:gas vesicle structural protein